MVTKEGKCCSFSKKGKYKDTGDYQLVTLSSLTSKIMIKIFVEDMSRHKADREMIRNIQHDALQKKWETIPD